MIDINSKLIFLDIDGVLNTTNYMRQSKKKSRAINPVAVTILNNLIELTDSQVVLSSIWRLGKTPKETTEILQKEGFKYEILDHTPSKGQYRGNQIKSWMDSNIPFEINFNEYVILDDDSDMLYWQRENFINVSMDSGLTPNIAYKAYRLLKGKRNWIDEEEYATDRFLHAEYHNQWKLIEQ